MKRILALVLIFALVACFAAVALADSATMNLGGDSANVLSPEHGNTDVEEDPSSPQTGYQFGIESVVLLAVLCGGVALFVSKKVRA